MTIKELPVTHISTLNGLPFNNVFKKREVYIFFFLQKKVLFAAHISYNTKKWEQGDFTSDGSLPCVLDPWNWKSNTIVWITNRTHFLRFIIFKSLD